MKRSRYKTTNKCLSFFLITVLGSVLLIPSKVYSEPVSAVTAAAIAALIKYASDAGVFRCAQHLQACSSLPRCNRTIGVLRLAESGTDGSVQALKDYINSSDEQRHCVRSMMGQPFIDAVLNWGSESGPDGGGTKAGQVGGVLSELMVAPNEWYVRFNDNWDRCGANGKFVLPNSNDIAQLADAVMSGRQVQFQFHCGDGFHIVDSWKWR